MALGPLALAGERVAITQNCGQSVGFAPGGQPCSPHRQTRAAHDPAQDPTSCCQSFSRAGGDRTNSTPADGRLRWPRRRNGQAWIGREKSTSKGRRRNDPGDLGLSTRKRDLQRRVQNRAWAPATACCCRHRVSRSAGGSAENPRPARLEWVHEHALSPDPGLNRAQRPRLAEPGLPGEAAADGPMQSNPSWARSAKAVAAIRREAHQRSSSAQVRQATTSGLDKTKTHHAKGTDGPEIREVSDLDWRTSGRDLGRCH